MNINSLDLILILVNWVRHRSDFNEQRKPRTKYLYSLGATKVLNQILIMKHLSQGKYFGDNNKTSRTLRHNVN